MLLRCWWSRGRLIALGPLLLHVLHVIHASHGWLLGCPGERWQGNQGRSEEQGEGAHASYAVHPPIIDPPAGGD
jgi:hypothetical protein